MFLKLSYLLLISIAAISPALPLEEASPEIPFNNRIIFSQTPEIGTKWHAGIRNKDLLCWDFYWNVNNWLTIDFLGAGLSNRTIINNETRDTTHWTDKFSLVTLKSRPITMDLFSHPYKLAFGITGYTTRSEFYNHTENSGLPLDTFSQGGLFAVQSWYLENKKGAGSHYFNLLTSFQSHKVNDSRSFTTWYIVPGYRFFFNHPKNLSFDFEYYIMNPYELPIKTLQLIVDPDQLPFENPNLFFMSFMFWGFTWSWKHAQATIHIGHHYTFAGPIVPTIGFGWDF